MYFFKDQSFRIRKRCFCIALSITSVLFFMCTESTSSTEEEAMSASSSSKEDTAVFFSENIKENSGEILQYLGDFQLINIKQLDSTFFVDLKYATEDNFSHQILYDNLKEALLHPEAAGKLAKAHEYLKSGNPNYRLLIYDAARPVSVQRKMWDIVKDSPLKAYVANPDNYGLHNYGAAVDITICDAEGNPLDMGTPFDYFGRLASVTHEQTLLEEGKLRPEQVKNRRLLRMVMQQAGFIPIGGEWWHFNACSKQYAKEHYELIE